MAKTHSRAKRTMLKPYLSEGKKFLLNQLPSSLLISAKRRKNIDIFSIMVKASKNRLVVQHPGKRSGEKGNKS